MITTEINNWFKQLEQEPNNYKLKTHKMIRTNELTVLLRSNTQGIDEKCLVIATITIEEKWRSKGLFKSFIKYLSEVNPWDRIIIEDIENTQLLAYFKKNFNPVNKNYETSFIINSNDLEKLSSSFFLKNQNNFVVFKSPFDKL